MDRNSYSHGELNKIFRTFAIMLILYENIDKDAQTAAEIHAIMFPNENNKNYGNYFGLEDLEFCLDTDKYIRKSVFKLIFETNIEFERYQERNKRTFKIKFNSGGAFRRTYLAQVFDFDLKNESSSRLSLLIDLAKAMMIQNWKDSFNFQYENSIEKQKKILDSMPPPSKSTRSGGVDSSFSSLSDSNNSKADFKLSKSSVKTYLSDMSNESLSELIVPELILRKIKNFGELYNFAGITQTRQLSNQVTIDDLNYLLSDKNNQINELMLKSRNKNQIIRRLSEKLHQNNIALCELEQEIVNIDDFIPPPTLPELSLSERLLGLMREANVLFIFSHFNEILSIRAGLIIQDLRSTCNCSMEKIPHIVLLILTLFFGIIEEAIMNIFIQSSPTYNRATERTNYQLRLQTKKFYNDINYSNFSIIASCLSADASNKKDNNWVVKPVVSLCKDFHIRARSFDTDFSISKKSLIGSEAQFESIVGEIGLGGTLRIRSGCADGFGVPEMKCTMKIIDDYAIAQWEANLNRDKMIMYSELIPEHFYLYGPFPVRQQRVKNCGMHSLQICFEAVTEPLMGDSGLNFDATVSQNIYKISYFQEQFKHLWNTLNIISVGSDIEHLNTLSKKVINKFKKFCSTRWLSVERQSAALVDVLNIEASFELIEIACETIIGGRQSNEWKEIAKKCSCIDNKDQVSHMIIMFLIISNHTPGGKAGVGLLNCSQIVSFLCSPIQRIAIKICAALFNKHIECATFIDSVSNVVENTKCINTKLIEATVFERDFMEWAYGMSIDWKSMLPTIAPFMEYEFSRCEECNFITFNRVDALNIIEAQMSLGCSKMMELAVKYFQLPLLARGFNILHSTDPYLSRHWAVAVLNGLVDSEIISLSNAKIAELHIITSTLLENELNCNIFPQPLIPHWRIDDSNLAFPNMSYKDYREIIYNTYFVNCDDEDVTTWMPEVDGISGIVSAYGLDHPAFVNELLIMASGTLLEQLQNSSYWMPGTPTEGYFTDIFKKTFPMISESLIFNFSYCLYAQTIAEQQFTVFSNLGHANSSEATVRKDLGHFFNVRSGIIRENKYRGTEIVPGESSLYIPNEYGKDAITKNNNEAIRPIRNKVDRLQYIKSLCEMGDSLFQPLTDEVQTVKALLGRGKRKNDMLRVFAQTKKEMLSNRKNTLICIGNTKIATGIEKFYTSAINRLNQLPADPQTIYESALSNKKAWSVKNIKAYIVNEDPNHNRVEVNKTKREIGINDPPNYRSLTMYITELWQLSGISTEQLKELSLQMQNGHGEYLINLHNIN